MRINWTENNYKTNIAIDLQMWIYYIELKALVTFLKDNKFVAVFLPLLKF